jgi:hypothetical protein
MRTRWRVSEHPYPSLEPVLPVVWMFADDQGGAKCSVIFN